MIKKYNQTVSVKVAHGVLGLMLIIGTLAGCKSADDSLGLNPDRLDKTRSAIQSKIPDAERSQSMLAVVDAFAAEAHKIIEDTKVIRLRIMEANQNYDTTREQLQDMYDELGVQIERLGNLTKEHSLKLRTLCSEEEWEEIFDHDDEAIEFKF